MRTFTQPTSYANNYTYVSRPNSDNYENLTAGLDENSIVPINQNKIA